jgi:hypothetical protein
MLPTISTTKVPQARRKRFIRQPEKLNGKQVTPKTLFGLAIVERYRLLPSSLLVRLMPGEITNNYKHLRTLFDLGYLSRFALPTLLGKPGEFVYYLDSLPSLRLLIEQGLIQPGESLKHREEIIRLNREKAYSQLHKDPDQQGKLLYIQHELMVSRFHAMLELGCRLPQIAGKIILEQWKQGTELWNRVQLPQVKPSYYDDKLKRTVWEELQSKEHLPHRPDAFFTLFLPDNPADQQRLHFFYEADRGSSNTSRYKMKLRAHWHYIFKQQLQKLPPYSVPRIKAVLTETLTQRWADNLREAAKENLVSGSKPSPLFWFTSSETLSAWPAGQEPPAKQTKSRLLSHALAEPHVIFTKIWQTPATGDQKFHFGNEPRATVV